MNFADGTLGIDALIVGTNAPNWIENGAIILVPGVWHDCCDNAVTS
jgi:hypothetical protein